MKTTLFTAAQIASKLGRSVQVVRTALSGIKPGVILERGKETAAYYICDLPATLRDDLETAARLGNYRNAEAMLAAPIAAPWQPPCKVSEAADCEIDRANKLRDALLPFLVREYR